MAAEIQIKNELDLQDFAEAERITPARGHGLYRFMYFATRVNLMMLLLLCISFVVLVFSEAGGIHAWSDIWRILLGLLVVGGFFGSRIRQAWDKRYGNAANRLGKYKYRLFDTTVVGGSGIQMLSGICDTLETSLAWDEFVGFHEGPRIFLVIQKGSHEELLIPKGSMTLSEQTRVRELLERNVGTW